MHFAVDKPHSKSISVIFISLKYSVLGLVFTSTLASLSTASPSTQCSLLPLNSVLEMFFLLTLFLDIAALCYFYCQTEFRCMEYYVIYGFHVIISLVCIFASVTSLALSLQCPSAGTYGIAMIVSSLLVHINAVIVMWSHVYFALKYVHFGSNLVWACLWLCGCSSALVRLVGFIHLFLAAVGLSVLLVSRFIGKTSKIATSWRFLTLVSIGLMMFCYVVVLIGNLSSEQCSDSQYFQQAYTKYGLLEILSPLLILCYLKGETGDPRESMIKSYEQVFPSSRENEFINIKE